MESQQQHQQQPIAFPPVPNETKSFTTRLTREGKTLRYELNVLQQPVRARACGSGQKSSADRRPVDPPPIVQLKVLEVKPNDVVEDITFMMNANYFLFATLEPARKMAHPRGMPDPNKPTVLTGTPVAGMVYLDRPEAAGYFIFPDLSVRHEGYFRLSFSLYEELKRSEDYDKTEDSGRSASSSDTHVTHRLEVKSAVLQVFSAKKFPGLTESTTLSRVVAEQGCRVRIRRDIRMRRQATSKGGNGKEWDDYEDDTASQRAKMAREPEAPTYAYAPAPLGAPPPAMEPVARPRSASNASHQSLGASLSRRQSQQELAQSYYQQQQQQQYGGTAPHTPQSGVIPASASAYAPSPSQQFSQPPYMQQQHHQHQPQQQPMQPPPVQYHPQSYQAPPGPPQQYHGYQPATAPQPQYATAPPESVGHAHRPSGEWPGTPIQPDYHRPSIHQAPAMPQQQAVPAPQAAAPTSYNPHSYQQAPQSYQPQHAQQPQYYAPVEAPSSRAPPPEPIQPPTRTTAPTPPLSSKTFNHNYTLPPISHALEPSSPAVATPTNSSGYFPSSAAGQQPSGMETHKRSYGSTFSTAHQDVAQKAGARSDSYSQAISSAYPELDVDDDFNNEFSDMTGAYKRANGALAMARSKF